tara:strand:+ start:3385 stop:3813 length:429 start_codon:yes stop_codon:yes gene_type:complete
MASFVKFSTFVEKLAEGAHNLGSDTLRLALTNTLPTAATDVGFLPGSSHPPPAAVNGYATGGITLAVTSSSQSGGIYSLVLPDTSFIGSGGSIGPFQYAILYNDTAASDEVIGYWDYGAETTIVDGEIFPIYFGTAGVVQVQ